MRILICDDHVFFRRSLRQLLETEKDFEVVGEADNGEQAVELARALGPDVILMDADMPRLDGVRAIRLIAAENQAARIILLLVRPDDQRRVEATGAGACACTLKDISAPDLVALLHSAACNPARDNTAGSSL